MIKDIVICKECKHRKLRDEKKNGIMKGFCYVWGGCVLEEDYCSKAEKRVTDEAKNI